MINAFAFRLSIFLFLVIGAITFIGSCKNPVAPREPNKFASQATFIRILDSISIDGQSALLNRGRTTDGLLLKDGSGYLFIGDLQLGSTNNTTLFISRTNALGRVLWTRLYDADLTIFPKSIIQEDNGFAIGGTSLNLATRTDSYLLKLNNNFEKVWSRSYDIDSTLQEINGVLKPNPNLYVLFGRATREVVRVITQDNILIYFVTDGYVASCDADGNLVAQRRIRSLGSRNNLEGSDVVFNSGASTGFGTVLAGFYTPVFGFTLLARDLYLLRLSTNSDTVHFIYDSFSAGGDVEKVSLANAKRNIADEAFSSFVSPSGELYTFGKTNSNFFVLKTDASVGTILNKYFIAVPLSASLK